MLRCAKCRMAMLSAALMAVTDELRQLDLHGTTALPSRDGHHTFFGEKIGLSKNDHAHHRLRLG